MTDVPRRVIRVLSFAPLPDAVADAMIQTGKTLVRYRSSATRNLPFHRSWFDHDTPAASSSSARQYHVLVHDFRGESHPSSYTDLFIAGSHRHPEFFHELQGWLHNPLAATAGDQFAGLTMETLNDIVAYLKHGTVRSATALQAEPLRQRLTSAQLHALPERFDAFLLPLDQSCVAIVDPRVLRRPCYRVTSATVRWKYVFHCQDVAPPPPGDDAPPPGPARQYEHRTVAAATSTNPVAPWPHRLTRRPPEVLRAVVQTALQAYGVACVPLAHGQVGPYTDQVARYLGRLLRLPPEANDAANSPLLDVRFVKEQLTAAEHASWLYRHPHQFCSRHIQSLTGRTHYGHYCADLHRLFTQLEELVQSAFSPEADVWATTAEIVLQY